MKKYIFLFIIAIIVFSLFPISGYSEDVVIDNIKIVPQKDLMVSLEVKNAFTKEIEEAINSGIATSFTFRIRLKRRRKMWFDKYLVKDDFKHTVKYDNLREEYRVSLPEGRNKPLKVRDVEDMKRLMTTIDHMPIVSMDKLKRGEKYLLGIKAELDTVNLPFPLNYLLFFASYWNFETDWYIKEIAF